MEYSLRMRSDAPSSGQELGQFSWIEAPYAQCRYDISALPHGVEQEVDDECLSHVNDCLSLRHSKFQLDCHPLRFTRFLVCTEDQIDRLMPKGARDPVDPRIGFVRLSPTNPLCDDVREVPTPIVARAEMKPVPRIDKVMDIDRAFARSRGGQRLICDART
jgi:hypothetical protein